jgi:hypothetical protein
VVDGSVNSSAPVSEADTQLERLLAQCTNCTSSALRSSQVAFLPLNASAAQRASLSSKPRLAA